MSIRAQQDYIFVSKYARYNKELKRRETWAEAVDRVLNMHLKKYDGVGIDDEIIWACDQIKQKKVLGSQRILQFGGDGIFKHNARAYNCSVSYMDRLRSFQEGLYVLLCGCGFGFSAQIHHVKKLPKFVKRNGEKKEFIVPDDIEGWADALGVLISSYLGDGDFKEYSGCDVKFNYFKIRPEGSPLSSSSGKAPGPEPLKRGLEKVREVLENRFYGVKEVSSDDKEIVWKVKKASQDEWFKDKLRPIDVYDIMMHASDVVLSGGHRRSASICLFSLEDEEMLSSKTGNWFEENPQRGRSNNSVVLQKDKITFDQFKDIIKSVKEFGEPGFFWVDSEEYDIGNPCMEILFNPIDLETGKTGVQFCNLCEINGKKIKSEEDFKIAAKAAAILGTLQAGYTDFPYLGEITEKITRKESLLGVSITGIMDNPDIILDPKTQREMAKLIVKTNEEISKKIGINPAARTTCIKPSGTTSLILGSSSGIHPHHASKYLKKIQANKLENPLNFFEKINPLAVESSVWSSNNTDKIISFCIEVSPELKTKVQMSAIELLENVKTTQQNWVIPGVVKERCINPWLTHNVSNTIHIRDEEWDDVVKYIYQNRKYFAGISLIPMKADLDYPQAPNCAIHTPRELVKEYGDGMPMASGLIVDGLRVFDDLWEACDYLVIEDKKLKEPIRDEFKSKRAFERSHDLFEEQTDWLRRVVQFSDRYLEGNIKKTTYLLKEVHNWKLWCDLLREYKNVDYTQMIEEEDNTKLIEEVACSGGKCEI